MATTIKLKNSVTTTNAPSSLVQGEVAINVTDKKVWVGNAATTPVQLLGTGADGSFTNLTVTNNATFDTTTLVVDATNNRVGVGTASPARILTVSESAPVFSLLSTSTSNVCQFAFGDPDDDNAGRINYDNSNDSMALWTSATERMRIDSSGNVGIGTASPAKLLDLSANNTGITTGDPANILRFTDSDTTSAADQPFGRIEWYSADADGAGVKAYIQGQSQDGSPDGNIVFATHTVSGGGLAERMRITYDGYLRMASGSLGIQFNGDTAAANALDDYEEGTFTPVLAGSSTAGTGTYTTRAGTYTKVGRLVTITVMMAWTAHTGTGNMRVTGLPFTSLNSANSEYYSVPVFVNMTMPASTTPIVAVGSNSSLVSILSQAVASGTTSGLAMDTAATVYFSLTYQAD